MTSFFYEMGSRKGKKSCLAPFQQSNAHYTENRGFCKGLFAKEAAKCQGKPGGNEESDGEKANSVKQEIFLKKSKEKREGQKESRGNLKRVKKG